MNFPSNSWQEETSWEKETCCDVFGSISNWDSCVKSERNTPDHHACWFSNQRRKISDLRPLRDWAPYISACVESRNCNTRTPYSDRCLLQTTWWLQLQVRLDSIFWCWVAAFIDRIYPTHTHAQGIWCVISMPLRYSYLTDIRTHQATSILTFFTVSQGFLTIGETI